MAINYTPTEWKNMMPPSVSKNNLNKLEGAVKQACDGVDALSVAPPTHSASHKHGGADEIATATPAANAVPKADGSGKLDAWVSDATTSTKGKVQLANSEELEAGTDASKVLTPAVVRPATIKRTKMPDGATALYCPSWTSSTEGWAVSSNCTVSASNGVLTMTATGSNASMLRWFTTGYSGKVAYFEYRSSKSIQFITSSAVLPASDAWVVALVRFPVIVTDSNRWVFILSSQSGDYLQLRNMWIGDYSYLDGSLSLPALSDVNLIGSTAASGAYASGTITSNGTNVSDGNTVTIHGKVYTFKTTLTPTEGQVLIGADAQTSLANLAAAINCTNPGTNDGVIYKIAAAHPLVSAVANGLTLTITALQPGELGNQITLAKSAATLTLSGSTLTGGYSATAKKLATLAAPIIAGNGTRPAAALMDIIDTAKIGYEAVVDRASGTTLTLPSGGTWIWQVFGYGATINSAKTGSSAGGTTLTVSGGNATVWYRRIA